MTVIDGTMEKPTILIVDDSPDDITLVSGLLKDLYKVKIANNGERALRVARTDTPPDLILLDIMMPVMDGYETCRHLKENEATKNIPVIFLTSKTELDHEIKGFELGAVDYITKPISPPIVLARVKTHLQLKSVRDYLQDKKTFLEAEVQKRTQEVVAAQKIIIEQGETLHESENLYRNLLVKLPAGVIVVDALTRTIESVNERAAAIFGDATEQIVGHHCYSFLCPAEEKTCPVLDLGQEVDYSERVMLLADGRRCPILKSVSRIQLSGREKLLECFVDITERKQAENQLHDTLKHLRNAMGTTIKVLVSTVEARDPYTAGHQLRSANLARAIAMEIGLSQEKIEGIRIASSIHDIGKISIPSEILTKPTRLTDLEFAMIKEHAQRGYELLKNVESPWPLAEIVYQHHERMDGSGYPRNLKGDEILIEARILSVADVVEAMASHRPYRPGLGIDAALNEIEKNRGTHYDNTVADACLRLFREKGFQLEGT